MVYDFDSEIHRISQEIDETTERDKMNKDNIEDDHEIRFHIEGDNRIFGLSDEDEEDEGKDWSGGLEYPEYYKSIMGLGDLIILKNPDEIVIQLSKITVKFHDPNRDIVVITITADKSTGFTKKDLADKLIKYYHMMFLIGTHYNFDKGVYMDIPNERETNNCFSPLIDCEYENAMGIQSLFYLKKYNIWEVDLISGV